MAHRWITALALIVLAMPSAWAGVWDVKSDTWVATDALGRELPGHRECGPPRAGKTVGIFYFTWLGQHGTGGPYDIPKLLAENPTDPKWGPEGAFHHWGESELGYYLSDDEYVIRRHCQMLVDAGVDTLILDVTNAITYTEVYMRLCKVFRQIRSEGGATPQMCFIANSSAPTVVRKLYDEFYSKNLYRELWFRWDGKPLILASTEGIDPVSRAFFTFRHSWAWSDPAGWFGEGRDKWPWLDHYPQNPGWHVPGKPEEIPVSIAEHPTSDIGRSFHNGKEPDIANQHPERGIFFADQWKRALEVDPSFIFITGWNEWVAQRFLSDGTMAFTGRKLAKGETFFVDEYTQEYSRDAEPMKGGHTDNYYYQMIAGIRKFKGVRAPESAGPARTISIDGKFQDWSGVAPEYRDTIFDTAHRNNPGWGSAGNYVNVTGRNDIKRLKVARDGKQVYFYAETQAALTNPKDAPNWMVLFVDADRNRKTGWEGYDFVLNVTRTDTLSSVSRYKNGEWVPCGAAEYKAAGNKLEIAVPRSVLGIRPGQPVRLDFHWADNISELGDITEFFLNGDSAPNRRFNYRYDTSSAPR